MSEAEVQAQIARNAALMVFIKAGTEVRYYSAMTTEELNSAFATVAKALGACDLYVWGSNETAGKVVALLYGTLRSLTEIALAKKA